MSAGFGAAAGAAAAAGFFGPGWNLLKLPFTTPAGALPSPAGLAAMLLACVGPCATAAGCRDPPCQAQAQSSLSRARHDLQG